jgi:aminocarboxymuconate-semialdehyde decarboxylase
VDQESFKMPNRRSFLKGMAGTALIGCGLDRVWASSSTSQQAGTPAKHKPVMVGGRKIKTVDVHCHVSVPEIKPLIKGTPLESEPGSANVPLGAERLAKMDEQGIDVEVVSINPFWYGADRDMATRLIELQNHKLVEMCAAHPERFYAYSSVALQFPELAAKQMEDGMKLGLRGAAIGGNVQGEELSLRKYDPFWAKAEELQAPIFMHPQANDDLAKRLGGNGVLSNVIGHPLETTIFLSHMIFEGTLERFPKLKICTAHGGGYLPSYADRSDHGCLTFPERCKSSTLTKKPTDYLKQTYVDSLVFTPEALRHLVAVMGPQHTMLGTDYPFPWVSSPVDHIFETSGLSDADRIAILGGNACKWLGIPA